MKVELREVAVVTKDNGEEVLVWDTGFVDRIRSLGVTLPPVPEAGKRSTVDREPKPESRVRINRNEPKHNDYGTRECVACHQPFKPRSGRAKVCDACRKAGALHKRSAADKSQTSSVMDEVRKLAADANLGPYGKGRDGDAS